LKMGRANAENCKEHERMRLLARRLMSKMGDETTPVTVVK
jgi:hypothetical protein